MSKAFDTAISADNPVSFRRRNIYTPLSAISRESNIEFIKNELQIKYARFLEDFLYKDENSRLHNYRESFLILGFSKPTQRLAFGFSENIPPDIIYPKEIF